MRKTIISIFGFVLCLSSMAQHSPITSQYLFNGLLINPAYAGSRDALATTLSYRHQWAGFEGAPKTTIATIHAPINKKKIALGMTVFDDQIGVNLVTPALLVLLSA